MKWEKEEYRAGGIVKGTRKDLGFLFPRGSEMGSRALGQAQRSSDDALVTGSSTAGGRRWGVPAFRRKPRRLMKGSWREGERR